MTDTHANEQEPNTDAVAAAQGSQEQRAPEQNGTPNGGGNGQPASNGTLATGAETAEPTRGYWPDDWRQKIAEHISAGDKDRYNKEIRRLENMSDPTVAWSRFREMENTWASRNFIKVPPKENASEADIKEYHKALGVPDAAEDYFKDLKLQNGAVFGEADKPVLEWFAQTAHKAGVPKSAFEGIANEFLARQEQQAAELDEADEQFRITAERALKDEFGPAYRRKTNAIATLFDMAPGGADVKNEQALYSRLMGGRMADGKLIGNDPDMVKFLVALAMDRNPAISVVEDSDIGGKGVDARISEIEKIMREDRPRYNKEFAGEYAELLSTREKIRARAR